MNRRAVLLTGVAAVASFGPLGLAYPGEAPPEADGPRATGTGNLAPYRNADSFYAPYGAGGEDAAYQREQRNAVDQLGAAYRFPTCGMQGLSSAQFIATDTPRGTPSWRSAALGAFAPDNPSRMFLSVGKPPMASVYRDHESVRNGSGPEGTGTSSDSSVSFDWREMAETVVGEVRGAIVDMGIERALEVLIGESAKRAYGPFSFVLAIVSPTELNGGQREELTYLDRLSPSERKEFLFEVLRPGQIPEPPPTGPAMKSLD